MDWWVEKDEWYYFWYWDKQVISHINDIQKILYRKMADNLFGLKRVIFFFSC